MKSMPRRRFHFPGCLLAASMALFALPVWANSTLTHVAGQVSILKLNGQSQPGAVNSVVLTGETIITGTRGFVRMKTSDGGWMVLPPSSQLMVEKYTYDEKKPAEDSFIFRMLKGGLRTATGVIGKRGNRDAYAAKTATATIGIRGTQYDMRVCEASNCGKDMPEGTYVAVKDGSVAMSTPQGTVDVKAGQVAAATVKAAPVILPYDPGVGFTPPAMFQQEAGAFVSPFKGIWTGRVISVFATSPALVEIVVDGDRIGGRSSWNTKQYPPEAIRNAVIKGDTLTYDYQFNQETGTATLTLDGKGKIKASFLHGPVSLPAELTLQPAVQ